MLLHGTVQFYTPRPTPSQSTTQNTSNVPPIMTPEVKKTPKEIKRTPGIDNLTGDVILLKEMNQLKRFNQILKKKILVELKEVKMIILHKEGRETDIKKLQVCQPNILHA